MVGIVSCALFCNFLFAAYILRHLLVVRRLHPITVMHDSAMAVLEATSVSDGRAKLYPRVVQTRVIRST